MTTTPEESPRPGYDGITYVIPCGGAKVDHPAAARDLYVGSMFRHTLDNVERMARMDAEDGRPARVLILSARYGLVELDTVLDPYDLRMTDPGSVTVERLAEQAAALGIDWGSDVYALLPRPYLARLNEALRTLDVYVQDVYEGCGGIGEQRRVNAIVGRATVAAQEHTGPGPIVYLGGDVNAFAWGVPILVSYGRLRDVKNPTSMPVAGAPWVLDSRGFAEIAEHGRWTIPAAQYVADVNRYADRIGHLAWAAPQDWPAAQHLLAKTGLSEEEHQRRTIASVVELRAMAPVVPIICVVTGKDVDGYLRHIEMYRAAGIDLHAEKHVIGVGALVGRPVDEVADIIRALYAAGLTRLHGFGVKGRVLDLVGGLLESIDSAAWSTAARHRAGRCPHGLVQWERNCPMAAREWGARQRTRAAESMVQAFLPLYAEA